MSQLLSYAQRIHEEFEDQVLQQTEFRGEISLSVKLEALKGVLSFLHRELGFNYLIDISSVDHDDARPRFEMVYELYHLETKAHFRIKARVEEDEEVPSCCDLWPTANWHEREIYDMMGIRFTAHPDLRRILMWEGYPFFPLRKEFPLAGKPSEMPDVAFTGIAPLQGGPFVTSPSACNTIEAEPRAKIFEDS